MVCHETYKDEAGNWLYPDEVEKISKDKAINKKNKSNVIVGPPESMSKSKKNTIDPEIMIKQYGADSVRWFILSDSPPEKDVQWTDSGVVSSNKFMQKIWNLVNTIVLRKEKKNIKNLVNNFNLEIDNLVKKIDVSINEFKFNVSIAHFYEAYNIFIKNIDNEIDNNCLKKNIIKIMKLMLPFAPHLSNECLEILKCKDAQKWPNIKENLDENIKIAIQVNGKTRDILIVKKNSTQEVIKKDVFSKSKAKKFLEDKKIFKTIFVKNKVINYIIK